METVDFPKCCGAKVIKGFWQKKLDPINGDTLDDIDKPIPPEQVDAYLKENQERWKRLIGLFVATLNETQFNVLKDVFFANGWKEVSKTFNPGHNSYVHLLIFDVNTEPLPPPNPVPGCTCRACTEEQAARDRAARPIVFRPTDCVPPDLLRPSLT